LVTKVGIAEAARVKEAAACPLEVAGSVAAMQPLAAEVMKEGDLWAIVMVVVVKELGC
jgi:hypothetical protein